MNIPAANLSSIMEENEFEFINSAIKERLNKDAKELKKLYQATVDGFKPETFHSKCDGIPNTLVLLKSEGNRRFGGFTPSQWTSSLHGQPFYDKNTFLFFSIVKYESKPCSDFSFLKLCPFIKNQN